MLGTSEPSRSLPSYVPYDDDGPRRPRLTCLARTMLAAIIGATVAQIVATAIMLPQFCSWGATASPLWWYAIAAPAITAGNIVLAFPDHTPGMILMMIVDAISFSSAATTLHWRAADEEPRYITVASVHGTTCDDVVLSLSWGACALHGALAALLTLCHCLRAARVAATAR